MGYHLIRFFEHYKIMINLIIITIAFILVKITERIKNSPEEERIKTTFAYILVVVILFLMNIIYGPHKYDGFVSFDGKKYIEIGNENYNILDFRTNKKISEQEFDEILKEKE